MLDYRGRPPLFLLSSRSPLQRTALQFADRANVGCLISTDPGDIVSALASQVLVLVGEDLAEQTAACASSLVGWKESLFIDEIERIVLLTEPDAAPPLNPDHTTRSAPDTERKRRALHAAQVVTTPLEDEAVERLTGILYDLDPPF